MLQRMIERQLSGGGNREPAGHSHIGELFKAGDRFDGADLVKLAPIITMTSGFRVTDAHADFAKMVAALPLAKRPRQ